MERYEPAMDTALALAERGWGRVSPNPMVGAVVLSPDDEVLGEGWHEGPGTDHAEVMALRAAGPRTAGATVVCTLEPCDRFGRTPPCTRALLDAGVARVVVAATDPHLGEGTPGLAELRAAGVDVIAGVREEPARRLNAAFERHVRTGRPYVIWKTASSLDGKTAAADGTSRWITSPEARADAHRWRAWADAIVVGSRTALADDPALTVRDVPATIEARPPMRILVDSAGRVPVGGALADGAAPTIVATTERMPDARADGWIEAGVDVADPARGRGGRRRPGLPRGPPWQAGRARAAARGRRHARLVVRPRRPRRPRDRLPRARVDRRRRRPGILAGGGFTPIDTARRFTFTDVARVGPDIRVEADVHRDR